MIGPSPLLELFKRGDVARDVRLLAAQGALAPRAHEQLAILVLLVDDPDPEIKQVAEETIARIPAAPLAAFLARPDAPAAVRDFFAARGVAPGQAAAAPAGDQADEPLVDTSAPENDDLFLQDSPDEKKRDTILQKLATMNITDKLKIAIKGSREVRAILVRDPNRMIATAVMSSPKLTEQEVETIARMANVTEDVLRIIGSNRGWMKNYSVALGLAKNPKTPVAISMNLISRLSARDLTMLTVDRNVPEVLRVAARKKLVVDRT